MTEVQHAKVPKGQLAYTETGPADGKPVVLVHAGIADRRSWDRVLPLLPADVRAIAYDQRGFGNSTWRRSRWAPTLDLLALLDALGLESVTLVGNSFGGAITLETTLYAPERVAALVLLAPPLPGLELSPEMEAYDAADEAALEEGRLEDSIALDLRTWVDGPTRQPEDVDAELRGSVEAALRHALTAQRSHPLGEERDLDVDFVARAGEIAVPTVVAVGDLDQPDFARMAARYTSTIPRSTLHRVESAGHLLPLEAPDVVARLIAGLA